MSNETTPLPEFGNPPVTEVVLSVQFDPLPALGVVQLGRLWNEYKERFPKTEEHTPLPTIIETFGARRELRIETKFEMLDVPPSPRLWFLTDRGDELIQVQKDRFIHNWRKRGDADDKEYPRYSHVREVFVRELIAFTEFLRREKLGQPVLNQSEVTYFNHLEAGKGWERHGQVHKALTTWSSELSEGFLPEPEDIRFAVRYVIPDVDGSPVGRLHVSLQPAYRLTNNEPVLVLELTARGRPLGDGIDGALRFLDLGHEWIVRGFTSLTTAAMHGIWQRRDR
jgi:uncharacterized protein (TIGR04255 family)